MVLKASLTVENHNHIYRLYLIVGILIGLMAGVYLGPFIWKYEFKMLHQKHERGFFFHSASSSRKFNNGTEFSIFVETDNYLHVTNSKYVSVAIDSSLIKERFRGFNSSSKRLLALARELSPCYLRVGGTDEDKLLFQQNDYAAKGANQSNTLSDNLHNFIMTGADWDKINHFTSEVGWELVFGLNILLRNGSQWDPSNAISLLRYSNERSYTVNLELGNEPNSFRHVFGRSVRPEQSGEDFGRLRMLMRSYPAFKSSMLIGPDVTELDKNKSSLGDQLTMKSSQYLTRFLKTGSPYIDAVSIHHYYLRSRTATLDEFTDPVVLDSLERQIKTAQAIINSSSPSHKPLWFGEVGSASGGGSKGISDRFVAGFLWLDRLGLSAVFGVDVIIRQSFYKGSYAMIDPKDYTPYPDYWLTVLYRRLVGHKVLKATANSTSQLRLYAHCTNTNQRSDYQPGAITVFVLNLYRMSVSLMLSQYRGSELDLYLLSPGDSYGLTSSKVKLNGQILEMQGEDVLPRLNPKTQPAGQPVHIQSLTFGYIVIPWANASVCL